MHSKQKMANFGKHLSRRISFLLLLSFGDKTNFILNPKLAFVYPDYEFTADATSR
jgi:hypothetical protein